MKTIRPCVPLNWLFFGAAACLQLLACSQAIPPKPSLCQQDSDCDAGELCVLGACHVPCGPSGECLSGQECVNGACVRICGQDADCGAGERCSSGYCIPSETEDGGTADGASDSSNDGSDGGGSDTQACSPGAKERCGVDVGTCKSGERLCKDDGTWSVCVGEVPPVAELCDNKDNDCDAETDEGADPPAGICLDLGVCADSTPICRGGRWTCSYPASFQPVVETLCDGQDNNCDGETDEDLLPPAEQCPSVGVCESGVITVCRDGGWICLFPSSYEPAERSCDGLDNDCDGFTDEDLSVPPAGTCLDQGVCAQGTASCTNGSWVCHYPMSYQTDRETVCDSLDNDCDSQTDEDLHAVGVCRDLGVCVGTVGDCAQGQWACAYPSEYQNPDLTCDGIDNDCDGIAGGNLACGNACCEAVQICRYDVCMPDTGGCVGNEDCQLDSYCDAGVCVPYGTGPGGEVNPECTRLIVAGLFQPALQCQWTAPPSGDYDAHIQVLGTPTVADFDFDNDPATIHPSIVFLTYDGLDGDSGSITALDGVLRIIDGATCQTQFSLGPYLNGSNPPAIGDLDADGRPEIVAHRNTGGVIAYKYDSTAQSWFTFWFGHNPDNSEVVFADGSSRWGGPSLIDLNDDGIPEILSGGLVYDATGLLLDSHLGLAGVYNVGFPVAADVDRDSKVELVNGNYVWEFDVTTHAWAVEWTTGLSWGYTAVADFGTYTSDPAQDNRAVLDGIAEVAVVSGGHARIITLAGRILIEVDLPASTGGGPPTIGDFDGDDRAELAASGSDSMTIFDLDCQGAPTTDICPSLRTDGILWTRVSQDHSSNITGSSLFDFEGDGPVEAIYADECFVRVYRGSDGVVLYSQMRSSCTWNENPIVADVDGDYSAELVVPANKSCGTRPTTAGGIPYDVSPNNNPMDPLFVGLPCKDGTDCVSGICDALYCRCADDSGCGGGGFVCAPPPGGTPGSGNTCRAEWQGSVNGVRVYRDSLDRWVGSRTIWNQHAYSITNVEENGTIPRTSQAQANWATQGLNNFRQNIQGDLQPEHAADMTSGVGGFGPACDNFNLPLHARVCNRGTNPIGSGINVGFFDGDPDTGAAMVCSAATAQNLQPGDCETVTCNWPNAPVESPHDVTVVVDYDNEHSECLEANNRGLIVGATCPYP